MNDAHTTLTNAPATTARARGIHIMRAADGRLMTTPERDRVWGGRLGVKLNGGKTVARTPEILAACDVLRRNELGKIA